MKILRLRLVLFICVIVSVFTSVKINLFCDKLYPWESVGGCGVSGGGSSGGGASGGLSWVGRGATGGLLDAELMSNFSLGKNLSSGGLSLKFSHIFLFNNNVALTFPLQYKNGDYRISGDYGENNFNGFSYGNPSLEVSRKFGSEYQSALTLSAGLPLAEHDARVASIRKQEPPLPDIERHDYLLPSFQYGNGLYSVGASYSHTIEKDWGMFILTAGYNHLFNSPSDIVKSFRDGGVQNTLWKNRDEQVKDLEVDKAESSVYETTYGGWFDLPFPWNDSTVPWEQLPLLQSTVKISREIFFREVDGSKGELIKGDFFGNSISTSFVMAYKTEKMVYSFQMGYSFKVSPDWHIRKVDSDYYKASNIEIDKPAFVKRYYLLPEYDKTSRHNWSFGYGQEISSIYLPVFFGLSAALDGRGAFQSASLTLGVKSSLF